MSASNQFCARCGAVTFDTATLPGCHRCMCTCGEWYVRRYVESEDTEFDVCDACEDWTPVREAVR